MSKFVKGIKKTAALPSWVHKMTQTMNPIKSAPAVSKKGITAMWKRRGVK